MDPSPAPEAFLREAIHLARENVRLGNGGPFGAVVVLDGEVIGRGRNRVTTAHDPTAHAEVEAIRDACRALGRFHLRGATIYASCEPCPMCLAAIYWARIDEVVFAADHRDAAAIGFDDALLYDELRRPRDTRRLPTRQMLRDEALEAFREWERSEDKIEY